LNPKDLTVKAFDITSGEGAFVFSKLDAGQYAFFADYKGKYMSTSNPVLEIEGENDSLHINAVAGVETIDIQVEVISDVEIILENNLKVYPVPVNERLTISFMNELPHGLIENIKIIGLNGHVHYEQNKPSPGGSDIVLDMSRYTPGIYLLRIQSRDAQYSVKIIRE
jgi:hypothetical protein